jgi:hypothetical protein
MKKVLFYALLLFWGTGFMNGQNILDDVVWDPEPWTNDPKVTELGNLVDLLSFLETEAQKDINLWFLELQFSSVKMLVEAYPPASPMINEMIGAYSNYNDAGGMHKYINGSKQLLLAYEFTPNVVSYVVCNLPEGWDPRISYPLYIWGTEGGTTPYPGGIHDKFKEQIYGGLLPRAPSSRFKDGYTIVPGGLGQRSYTFDCARDFFKGMNRFIENFKTDKSKYYLGGFSNGGRATYYISTTDGALEKYKFAGLAMYAPNIDDAYLTPAYSSRISDVPVWVGAGENDDTYGAIAKKLNDHLTDEGYPPAVYDVVEGIGHTWTQDTQGDMCYFLQEQQRLMPGEPPMKPGTLKEDEAGERQLKISWTDNSDNELLFVVERQIAGERDFKEVGKVAPNLEYFIDRTVVSGTKYIYRVYAYNESGISEPSNELGIKTPGKGISNVAFGKKILVSAFEESSYNLIDGHTLGTDEYRWNAENYPQWAEIDLKAEYDISLVKLYAYDNREYLYTIEVKTEDGEYATVVDKSSANVSAPAYIDELALNGRYVKLTVSGALVYPGTKINIAELEVYGKLVGELDIRDISLDKSALDLTIGEKSRLTETLSPDYMINSDVKWKSSDETVAKVNIMGVVTAISEGTATITVTTAYGNHSATCDVRVTSNVGVADTDVLKPMIYPNPCTTDHFSILIPEFSGQTVTLLRIFDFTGKLVHTKEIMLNGNGDRTVTVETKSMRRGIYLIAVNTGLKTLQGRIVVL